MGCSDFPATLRTFVVNCKAFGIPSPNAFVFTNNEPKVFAWCSKGEPFYPRSVVEKFYAA